MVALLGSAYSNLSSNSLIPKTGWVNYSSQDRASQRQVSQPCYVAVFGGKAYFPGPKSKPLIT